MVGIYTQDRAAKSAVRGISQGPKSRAVAAAMGVLALALPATAHADNADVAATTELIVPLVLTKTQDLDFGRIIAPSNGRVDVFPNETCTANNLIILVDGCQPAKFIGSGQSGQTITLTMPTNRRFEITGPGRDMRIRIVRPGAASGLNFQGRSNNIYTYVITDANGDFSFNVAGRALMRNNQETGVWTGTFNVSLDYQ